MILHNFDGREMHAGEQIDRIESVNLDRYWRLQVTAGLHWLKGNQRPYFSATAGEISRRNEENWRAAGCLHEDILKHFPWAAPVVRVHLSDDRGWPMHAVENGLYWLGLTAYPKARNLETFANHLRCTPEMAAQIDEYVTNDPGSHREALRFCIRDLEVQWLREAQEAFSAITQIHQNAAR